MVLAATFAHSAGQWHEELCEVLGDVRVMFAQAFSTSPVPWTAGIIEET